MGIFSDMITVNTRGENNFLNITELVRESVEKSRVSTGSVTLFLLSTTSSLRICEDESGLLVDFSEAMRKIAPDDMAYRHNMAWDDNNGRSHIKATILGQDLTVPVRDGTLLLGTWQNIFLMEFDLRPRTRRISVTVMGSE